MNDYYCRIIHGIIYNVAIILLPTAIITVKTRFSYPNFVEKSYMPRMPIINFK